MLVKIGNTLLNPYQIVSMKESRMGGDPKGPKTIHITMSNGKCFTCTAGYEGYAAACVLRDMMLGRGNKKCLTD